jgi:hypothetical protein
MPQPKEHLVRIIKILVLAAVLAAGALLSGASWASKAHASCTSGGRPQFPNNPLAPSTFTSSGHTYLTTEGGGLVCNANDQGELWLWIDWRDSSGVWHALNAPTQFNDYTGSLDYHSYGTRNLYIDCANVSRQIFRARYQWNNWTTGVNGSQSIVANQSPSC